MKSIIGCWQPCPSKSVQYEIPLDGYAARCVNAPHNTYYRLLTRLGRTEARATAQLGLTRARNFSG